jgi:hypothetical protein
MSPDSTASPGSLTLTAEHQRQLAAAVDCLESTSFAARLAEYAGQPINAILRYTPGVINRRVQAVVRQAIFKCLELAVRSLDDDDEAHPSEWSAKLITGLAGGIGGFFGMAALPVELPLTTTLMLRSIAEIARDEGEDLKNLESLLACLEVFALGGRGRSDRVDVDYYAVRTVLAKLTRDVAALVLERGAVNATSPIVTRFVGEIVGRFSLVVTDRVAAGAAPVIGAVGGATVNVVFTDHFQRIARGHFIVRRLERVYGVGPVQGLYREQARALKRRRMPRSRQSLRR